MHVVLFDIDGTLIVTGGAGKVALESALASEWGITPSSDGLSLSGRTDRAIVRDLFLMHGIEPSDANWKRLAAAYLAILPACLARHQGKVLPGIAALLESFAVREDVAVGLLTGNVRAGAMAKLGHYGLWHHFAFGGFGDAHSERDDVAREALAATTLHLRGPVVGECIWVIGDTPFDVRCARSIGARALAVGTGWHSLDELAASQPDLLLPDLSDPTPLFQALGTP